MVDDEASRALRGDGRQARNVPLLAQGLYYIVAGLWPLVDLRSFEALTGPKPDRFVVEATGLLFAASGAALAVGAVARGQDRSSRILSALVPMTSTFVALRHRPQVRAVYLADAAAQFGMAVWVTASRATPRTSPGRAGA